jgi:hypothetical protein
MFRLLESPAGWVAERHALGARARSTYLYCPSRFSRCDPSLRAFAGSKAAEITAGIPHQTRCLLEPLAEPDHA